MFDRKRGRRYRPAKVDMIEDAVIEWLAENDDVDGRDNDNGNDDGEEDDE